MGRQARFVRCLPPRGLQIGGGDIGSASAPPPLENVIRKTAAVYAVGSGSTGPFTIGFAAHNPSPRLRWSISVAWELAGSLPFAAGAGAPTWQMRAVRRSAAGATADLNNVFTAARALPDAYELDSAVKDVRGSIALTNTDLATGLSGSLIIEARWEPNGFVDDDVRQLIRGGDLQVVGGLVTVQNTS